jgi:hypothetical protein
MGWVQAAELEYAWVMVTATGVPALDFGALLTQFWMSVTKEPLPEKFCNW